MKSLKRHIAALLAVCIMASLVFVAPVRTLATSADATPVEESTTPVETPTEQDTESDVEGTDAETVYYLFGSINGANYACEEDYENMGEYKFVDGKLTATFTADSYVAIKEENNANWYMAESYIDTTSGTFYNTSTGASEKMYVPANMDITFTLTENEDGSLTLSYVAVKPECDHSYTEKVLAPASCVKNGLKSFTCSKCGHNYTELISATGHTNTVKVTEATCLTYTSYQLTCKTCGRVETLYADKLALTGLDAVPNGMDPKLFTTDPLFRYRTQKLATSLEPTMDGYTQIGTEWVDGNTTTIYYVKSWPTGFDKTNALYKQYNNIAKKVTAYENETAKLEIDSDAIVGYLYYHWCYEGHPYTVAVGDDTYNRFHAYYSTVAPSEADKSDASDNSYRFDDSTACADSLWYFAVPVYGQSYTEYDKQYVFEQWSEWSEWSTTPVAATASREVETITGYRYINAALADHDFVDGFCSVCGTFDPDNIGYHLVGYINGANYGCEEDWENIGKYRFVDGKLTVTFVEDSYIFLKTSDNVNWYMTQEYADSTMATFLNTTTGTSEKMYVPGDMEITFTLTENEDGSLSLSYVAAGPDCVHSYTSKVTVASGCTTTGIKTFNCTKCGHIYSETTPATGHSNNVKITPATCSSYASYELTCKSCGFHQVLKADELAMTGLDEVPDGMDPKLFTTDPLYRYRTRKTATSYESTMEGYTQVGTTWVEHSSNTIYYVKSWPAGFDKTHVLYNKYNNIDNKITESEEETTKVAVKSDEVVGYLYYHWCYEEHPNDYSVAQKEGLFVNFCAYYSTKAPSNYTCDYTDMSYKVGYANCTSSNWFFVAEVYGQTYGEYDKQYAFESWSDWSAWSTTPVTATANREVEAITGYRYLNPTLGNHIFANGACTLCNEIDADSYYLVGHINGADYGCEADHENVGKYRFENGKLTTTFETDSYVFLKTGDNANWYMSKAYISGSTGKFYNTTTGTNEKMYVPGGVEVTFTLTESVDGSLTLSYVTKTCAHTYTSKVTTAATCTKAGVKTFTCSKCGNSYTEAISPIGHSYTSKVTTAATCTKAGVKTFTCSKCGDTYTEAIPATGHSYTSKVTTAATCTKAGVKTFTCSKCGGTYTEAIPAAGHSFANGKCTVCGIADPNYEAPSTDYYLFGYINGANYGCEEDHENLGEYKFVDGKLTATFEQDSYIGVKTGDNANWYMFQTYVDTTSGTLYNTSTGASEKMRVPGGVTMTFTLVENADGSLTLCYVNATPVVKPTLTLQYPTLAFEAEILYNAYVSVTDMTSVVELGMITFASRLAEGTITDAVNVIPGYFTSGTSYVVSSNGVPAKQLGDALYFKAYAKLTDGTYVYSSVAGYHAVAYAQSILATNADARTKALMVAMLNYGAAAQVQFNYKTDTLMNASLTEEQLALVKDYDATMVDAVVKADTNKVGKFVHNGGYTSVYPSVSFEGAFAINYYFTTKNTPDAAPTFYYWDAATYASVDQLTAENATGTIAMTKSGSNWIGTVSGIAAKEIDQTYYVAAVYNVGTTAYYSPVISYSLGAYCVEQAGLNNAFGAATAVYGYYAKAYFA